MKHVVKQLLLALCLLILPACVTAKKQFEHGQHAESAGRWADAANYYVDTLRRDSGHAAARARLEFAGSKAVVEYFRLARRFHASSRFEDAAAEFRSADELMRNAASLRAPLDVPSGYAAQRSMMFGKATDALLAEADRLSNRGKHAAAARQFDSAYKRFEPSDAQKARAKSGRYVSWVAAADRSLAEGRFDDAVAFVTNALAVYGPGASKSQTAVTLKSRIEQARYRDMLVQATERMDAGRYQSAYLVVTNALTIYGADAPASADACALRDRIVEAGTVSLVAIPVWRGHRLSGIPAGLIDDINDHLDDEYWCAPPMFIRLHASKQIRRELRRAEYDRRALSEQQACIIGRLVNADFVVVPLIVECEYDRSEIAKTRTFQTKNGPPAEILVRKRRTLLVACRYRVVRVEDGSVLAEGRVQTESVRDVRHALPNKNAPTHSLVLTDSDRCLFDVRRLEEVDRHLHREVAASLAEGISAAVYEHITRHLP